MGTSGPAKDHVMNIMQLVVSLTTGVMYLTTEVHTLIGTRLPAQLIHNIGKDILSKFLELIMIVSIG